jgi:hypothetical protein
MRHLIVALFLAAIVLGAGGVACGYGGGGGQGSPSPGLGY